MANKLTKREVINAMLVDEHISTNAIFVEYLEHEIELLNRKSINRKPTERQVENVRLMEVIKEVLKKVDNPVTVTELQKLNAELEPLANQKISALLKKLVDNGEASKIMDKKKATFIIE